MSFVSRAARTVVLTLGSIAIFLAAGEALSRTFHLVDRLNGFPRRLFMATDDPDLPYLMRPGVDTTVRGVRVTVNEYGLRGPSVTPIPVPEVKRILVVGDSAAFGEGLAIDEAFPALLERELAARTGERYEVLNGGVEGYNTRAELAFLRHRGLALRPEIVIVGFNLNDFDYAPVMGPLGVLTRDQSQRVATRSLANISEFYLLLRWLALNLRRLWAGGPGAATPGPPRPGRRFSDFDLYISTLRKRYYANPTDERWEVMVESLRGLGRLARTHGLRLIIAILPDGDQIGVPEPDILPQRKLAAICAAEGLECLDLQPAFATSPDHDLFLDTMHPNAAGHRIVARALADYLLSDADAGM